MKMPFRVSTGLKSLIGRDLITNDFVAVFELVKNSFDAHATSVKIVFRDNSIVIADDGKGMSRDDILQKWLFVAYSAKREGIEDEDYRDKIADRRRPFAGAKGVGRFSCDRLGAHLSLRSRAAGRLVQKLEVDWPRYEIDAKEELGAVMLDIEELPDCGKAPLRPKPEGTILKITGLRSGWDRTKLLSLKRELAKLINPFSPDDRQFNIELVVPDEAETDRDAESSNPVNGWVENTILEVLKERTTSIRIALVDDGDVIESRFEDRGRVVYRIQEPNRDYTKLHASGLRAEIYYLNRSAKTVFARRMGLASVQFGSIFLFRNGFRVYPIGEQHDDFFGLSRRKQQGQRRYLGSRDLIGMVEVGGVSGFDEATSRDQGLIRTPQVEELIACIVSKCVRRLERYVVDISWKDDFDKDSDTTDRMRLDQSSARITSLVSRLAATEGVELLGYDEDLVRLIDEKSQQFESSLRALEVLAEKTGDSALLSRVSDAKARIAELETAEAEAREAELRAERRAHVAERAVTVVEAQLGEEVQRNQFLVAAASLDEDTVLNLHHQIIMHASDVHLAVKRMMRRLRKGPSIGSADWVSFLERLAFRNSQILTASRFATKGGYKKQSAELESDLAVYIRDYVSTVASLWAPRGVVVDVVDDGKELVRSFPSDRIGDRHRQSRLKLFQGASGKDLFFP